MRIPNLFLYIIFTLTSIYGTEVNQSKTIEHTIYGPGLDPTIVMTARYFFITVGDNTYDKNYSNNTEVQIKGVNNKGQECRVWINKLDRKDGTLVIRYRIYETCYNISIRIFYKNSLINNSTYQSSGPVQPEECDCPESNFNVWLHNYGCTNSYEQIVKDLERFQAVNMTALTKKIISKYHRPESTSFCHYIIKDNKIYRECYGKYVGFNMFFDNIMLSLTRKIQIPDMELIVNLGDWPLVSQKTELLPIFSWCGSDDTYDIVMPTYDITESVLENMRRVTLDILSVQGSTNKLWSERFPKAFWRGRDSREERLKLIDIARAHPDLFNVSMTNFFFFRDQESNYGPKLPHISFFDFFDYKYQINVDGTVAAYRLPYLLGGGSVVLKQDSPYYEHFYKKLIPWQHFIPIKRDLSDLVDKVKWAQEHDDESRRISLNALQFVNENLLPQHIICYYAVLLSEWSKRLLNDATVPENMTYVPQPQFKCDCQEGNSDKTKDEL